MRQWHFHDPRIRRSPGPPDPAHRRREARLERALDARRAVGALRPRAAGRPARARRSRPRPLPALQGPRAGGLLRRARREGLHRRRRPRRLRRLRLAAGQPPRSHARSRASRSPAARSGTGCRSRSGTRSALEARGRRRARVFCLVGDAELDEGSNWEAVAARRPARARPADGGRRRQPLRRPTTGRAASPRASSSRAGARRASTAATTTRSSGRCAATGERPHVVVAEVAR